jgi:DnaK suppressor protein
MHEAKSDHKDVNAARGDFIRRVLDQNRDLELARIRQLRREQSSDEALAGPGDEAEVAHAMVNTEMQASMVERYRERLRAIDEAERRLDQGRFGICEECGEDIGRERLKMLPSTLVCVDCQRARERNPRLSRSCAAPTITSASIAASGESDENASRAKVARLTTRADDSDLRAFSADSDEDDEFASRMVDRAPARRGRPRRNPPAERRSA